MDMLFVAYERQSEDEIHRLVKKEANKAGISLNKLSVAIGKDMKYLTMCHAKGRKPSYTALCAVASYLKIPVGYLIGGRWHTDNTSDILNKLTTRITNDKEFRTLCYRIYDLSPAMFKAVYGLIAAHVREKRDPAADD